MKQEKQNRFNRWLVKELRERGINKTDLARACHTTPSYISHITSGMRVPNYKMVIRIAGVLECPSALALQKAGLLPRHEITAAKRRLMDIIKKLPEKDVEALLALALPAA